MTQKIPKNLQRILFNYSKEYFFGNFSKGSSETKSVFFLIIEKFHPTMVLQLLLAQFVHLSWGLFSCIINRFSPSNFFHFYRIFFQRIFRDKKVFFIFLELLKKISSRCDFPITSRPHFYFPHKDYSAVSVL